MMTTAVQDHGGSVAGEPDDPSPTEIEFRQWRALSSDAGAEFYARVTAADAVFAVPSPHATLTRRTVLDAVAAAPRIETYQILEFHERALGPDAFLVFYEMYQKRVGLDGIYAAISTVYVRRNSRWLMQYHQQTPLQRGSTGSVRR
ncbi:MULTISPECIES: DUF4440 domain-containing protein [unclassified Nocardia]|uniref:DUF4440 domain-containing protein n=2 Tax=Nocardia TaxID=1817 RepID=UPI00278C7660|nr:MULTISPECIES: DUF4440 domain-containing protein [unclassified Nocardia]